MGKYDYLIAKEIERLNNVQIARTEEKARKANLNMHDEALAEFRAALATTYDALKVVILSAVGLFGLFLGCIQATVATVMMLRIGSNYIFYIDLFLGLTNILISCILITFSRIGLKVYEDK